MTLSIFQILSIVLAVAVILDCYFSRFPAVVWAWLGLLAAHFAGAPYISGKVLLFWGIASVIVMMLNFLQPKGLTQLRAGMAYVTTGTIAGTALGYLYAPAVAWIIIGATIGAFLGAVAFMRLPKGPKVSITSPEFLQYLCAKGLPTVVSCSQVAIVLASAL